MPLLEHVASGPLAGFFGAEHASAPHAAEGHDAAPLQPDAWLPLRAPRGPGRAASFLSPPLQEDPASASACSGAPGAAGRRRTAGLGGRPGPTSFQGDGLEDAEAAQKHASILVLTLEQAEVAQEAAVWAAEKVEENSEMVLALCTFVSGLVVATAVYSHRSYSTWIAHKKMLAQSWARASQVSGGEATQSS